MNEYNRKWKKENPEILALQKRNYYFKKHGYYPEDRPEQIRITRPDKVYEIGCGFCPNQVYLSKRNRKYCPIHKRLGNKSTRFEILKRDNFTCRYCGRKAPEVALQVDHIIPRAKGGTIETSNLITACSDCNLGKSDVLLNVV